MAYTGLRVDLGPSNYARAKTPVTADLIEAGFIAAVIILALTFLAIIPGFRGLKPRLCVCLRIAISLFVGVSICLSAYGQEWESAFLNNVPTYYKAFFKEEIHADIGVKIGLNSVNITLKSGDLDVGDPNSQNPNFTMQDIPLSEKINYNERFPFWGGQGRIGFGRYSGRINREFRAAQWRGMPYPILWIAEYFTLDGEDILWGRSYRLAGWYAWIMVWTAFPMWLLANILFFMVVRLGAYFLMMCGASLLTANIMYASIRYGTQPMIIPFSAEHKLHFYKGGTFYLCMVAGIVSFMSGCVVLFLDFQAPVEIANFFGVDPLQDFEDTFVYEGERQQSNGHASATNGDFRGVQDSKPVFQSRNKSRFVKQKRTKPRKSIDEGANNHERVQEVGYEVPAGQIAMTEIQAEEVDSDDGYDNKAAEITE